MDSDKKPLASSRFTTWTMVALLSLVGASFVGRAWLAVHDTYDPDEFFSLGTAWRIGEGKLPYLDFLDLRSPTLLKIYSVPLRRMRDPVAAFAAFRRLHLGLAIVLYGALFFLVRRLWDFRAGLWAVGILSCLTFFLPATVQIRPDLPALIAATLAAGVLIAGAAGAPSRRRTTAAAGLAGLAAAIHFTMAAPLAGVGVWLFFAGRGQRGTRGGAKNALWFAVIAVAVCWSTYVWVYGLRLVDAAASCANVVRFGLDLIATIPANRDSGELASKILWQSLPAWAAIIVLLGYSHVQLTAARAGTATQLPLLAADASALFLLSSAHLFPQRFLPLALFGSAAAAGAWRDWTSRFERRFGPRAAGAVELAAAIALFVAGGAGAAQWLTQMQRETGPARAELALAAAWPADPAAGLAPETARQRMSNYPTIRNPFRRLPKEQRDAQLRFILAHSSPTDEVFTNWLNPPFRRLPTGVHDGYELCLHYRSPRARTDARYRAWLQRFFPYYSTEDATQTASLVRILDGARPALILLEGCPAEQFLVSGAFRNWLAARYRIQFDPPSNSFYAVRDPAWN